jgi:beta propeller repeat protein
MKKSVGVLGAIALAVAMVVVVVGVVQAQTISGGTQTSSVTTEIETIVSNSSDYRMLLAESAIITRTLYETRVTSNTQTQWRPSVYGDNVVWQDQHNGNADIYMANLQTLTETAICKNTFNQEHPDIYENYIVWYDWRNYNADIYLYDLQTLTETWIVSNTANQRLPRIWGD